MVFVQMHYLVFSVKSLNKLIIIWSRDQEKESNFLVFFWFPVWVHLRFFFLLVTVTLNIHHAQVSSATC